MGLPLFSLLESADKLSVPGELVSEGPIEKVKGAHIEKVKGAHMRRFQTPEGLIILTTWHICPCSTPRSTCVTNGER